MEKVNIPNSVERLLFKLKLFREVKLINQTEAAAEMGIGLRSYQRIEAGESVCDIEFLYKFCNFFQVDFNLLTSPNAPEKSSNQIIFSADEEKNFEDFDEIKNSNFLEFTKKITDKYLTFDSICNSEEFLNFPYPLMIFNPHKKCMNHMLAKETNSTKLKMKTFEKVTSIEKIILILDNIYYHRPKYSAVNPSYLSNSNQTLSFRAYNQHFLKNKDDQFSLCIVYKN